MSSRYNWMFLGVAFALHACYSYEPPEPGPSSLKIEGPADVVSYDAIGNGKLAFQRMGRIYIIDADARTSWGLNTQSTAVLSPDAKHIAYCTIRDPYEIMVYDIESDRSIKGSGEVYSCTNPGWTADSQHILFEMHPRNSPWQIAHKPVGVYNLSTVREFEFHDESTSPISASPSGHLLITLRPYSGRPGIFTMKIDGTQLTQLTTDSNISAKTPVWSPDGNLIAYLGIHTDANLIMNRVDIIIMNKEGANASTLASYPATRAHSFYMDDTPSIAWSPDGAKLAFTMYDPDGIHIYVINADGSGLAKLTGQAGVDDINVTWTR